MASTRDSIGIVVRCQLVEFLDSSFKDNMDQVNMQVTLDQDHLRRKEVNSA